MSLTRREFLTTSAAAAIAGKFVQPGFALAQQGQAPQPVFTPIRRNVGFFTMRGGTIGYLVNAGGVVCVDSQFPAEATACLNGLKERSEWPAGRLPDQHAPSRRPHRRQHLVPWLSEEGRRARQG